MDIAFLFAALVAEIAGTVSGFGSSSILLPFAHHFFSYQTAILLVAIYHIFGNTTRLALTYQHWDRRIFLLFGIPSVIATIIGASLIAQVDIDVLKVILGIVLILFAMYSLWSPKLVITPTPLIARIGGALSGFTAGLIGTGGVLRGAFMTLFGLSRERYIATIASIALLVDITRIPLYLSHGGLSRDMLVWVPVLFVIAYIGTRIGKAIITRVSPEILRRVILIAIMIVSSTLVWQGLEHTSGVSL